MSTQWHVYMVRCADNSLYTGIAVNVEQRIQEHNSDTKRAARYTRARRPVSLVYVESVVDRSSALKREHALRRLTRMDKERLISNQDTVKCK